MSWAGGYHIMHVRSPDKNEQMPNTRPHASYDHRDKKIRVVFNPAD